MTEYLFNPLSIRREQSLADDAEVAELARMRERFRGSHLIYREITPRHGTRYVAHGTTVESRPHTLVTNDLGELNDELEQSAGRQLTPAYLALLPAGKFWMRPRTGPHQRRWAKRPVLVPQF
jgi:hypothetical protein